MTKSSARYLLSLLVLPLLAIGSARADYMNWTYSSSALPPGFAATGAGGGGGAIQLTPFTNVAGGSSITALAYQTSAGTSVNFDSAHTQYTLTMTITDTSTHDTGTLSFAGSISGSLSPTSSTLMNTFAVTQKSLTLDGHTYTVTLPSTASLAAPNSPQQNIMAHVSVTNATTHGTPEPASALLGSLGACLAGLGGLWNRRRLRARQDT